MSRPSRDVDSLNKDDEKALRQANLAMSFANASAPLSSEAIHRGFYQGLKDASFNSAFRRDREDLALGGFGIRMVPDTGPKPRWELDPDSLATGPSLNPYEVLFIDTLCQPLLQDGSFPLRDSLVVALAKVRGSFSGLQVLRIQGRDASNSHLNVLMGGFSRRQALDATYVDAQGLESRRTLEVLGAFAFEGRTYLVCRVAKGKGEGSLRTFLLDRFRKVKPLGREGAYEIPGDFDVEDFKKLPFQMGETRYRGVFRLSSNVDASVRRRVEHQGRHRAEESDDWVVSVADTDRAARWCIAEGVIPLAPQDLIDAYRGILGEATRNGAGR